MIKKKKSQFVTHASNGNAKLLMSEVCTIVFSSARLLIRIDVLENHYFVLETATIIEMIYAVVRDMNTANLSRTTLTVERLWDDLGSISALKVAAFIDDQHKFSIGSIIQMDDRFSQTHLLRPFWRMNDWIVYIFIFSCSHIQRFVTQAHATSHRKYCSLLSRSTDNNRNNW